MSLRFAWPQYRQPWQLDLSVTNAEDFASPPEVDPTLRRIDLTDVPWSTVTLAFSMTTSERSPVDADELAYALVSSTRSNTRIPVPLDRIDSGHFFNASVELRREELAGAVEVVGQVLREDGSARLIGQSDPWVLVVDTSAAPPLPGAPPFRVAWKSFASDDAPTTLQRARTSYAVMDLTGPEPVLYLNEDVRGLQAVLESTHAKLEKRRARDTLSSGIARYAVAALLREALAKTFLDDDDVQLPQEPLLRQICDVIASEVDSVTDTDELCRVAKSDGPDRAASWIEIDNALDRLTNHSEYVARNMEEVYLGQS